MDGFKKFLLQGDLVSLAVAFIIGGAFSTVVKAFVAIIMDLIGKLGGTPDFSAYKPGGVHVGAFLTALVAFVILAAVVYFAVVKPYTAAKERFFPAPDPGET
ncbi:MAG: MscL family protein, partial [Nocardioides sp.]|nr:MscL family protein [Nocardioides sp.]